MSSGNVLRDIAPSFDLLIVGAGPAGMSAAAEAGGAGLSVLLADDGFAMGGQIYRGQQAPIAALGGVAESLKRGAALARACALPNVQYCSGTSVWHLDRQGRAGLSQDGHSRAIQTAKVILATGSMERPFPIPGGTLPGVLGAGGVQTLLKSSGLLPDGRIVLAGMGPLLWLLADQLAALGRAPVLMLDTTPAGNLARAMPGLPQFLSSDYGRKGLSLLRRTRKAMRVVHGARRLAIGADQPLRIDFEAGGRRHGVVADHIVLHQGVVPNAQLANAVGCDMTWDRTQAFWKPSRDDWGRTSLPGLLVAGDGAGIEGALAAEARGRLAALAVCEELGVISAAERDERAAPIWRAVAHARHGRRFIDRLYTPPAADRRGADEAIACRCEAVSGAAIRQVAARLKTAGPNQLKGFLRCGMGPCQGRMCGLPVAEIIADAQGRDVESVGLLHQRSPIRPVSLGELAAIEPEPAA
jgi:NADPH-dependent 2,4-dienoyl-CoA reductase/sulfur reductase-like enzyme